MLEYYEPEKDLGTPVVAAAEFVDLVVDGMPLSVAAGTSVMRAAATAGIKIPKLCATDVLEAEEIRGIMPGIEVSDGALGAYEPDGGFVDSLRGSSAAHQLDRCSSCHDSDRELRHVRSGSHFRRDVACTENHLSSTSGSSRHLS